MTYTESRVNLQTAYVLCASLFTEFQTIHCIQSLRDVCLWWIVVHFQVKNMSILEDK